MSTQFTYRLAEKDLIITIEGFSFLLIISFSFFFMKIDLSYSYYLSGHFEYEICTFLLVSAVISMPVS